VLQQRRSPLAAGFADRGATAFVLVVGGDVPGTGEFVAGLSVVAVLFAIDWAAGWIRVTGAPFAVMGLAGSAALLG
jgi:hypothetical protein